MNLSTCELRLSELEAGLKKHEELTKTVENLSKQLNEIKTQLVKMFLFSNYYIYYVYLFLKTKKGME